VPYPNAQYHSPPALVDLAEPTCRLPDGRPTQNPAGYERRVVPVAGSLGRVEWLSGWRSLD
jgi:hypothetical protein